MQAFALERPPVTRVRATVFFEHIAGLRLTGLSGFLQAFKGEFPLVKEQFPIPSLDDRTGEGEFVALESLPLPLVIMEAVDGNRELSFQSDRFSLSWRFDTDAGNPKEYPGFEVLRAQLARAYEAFRSEVTSLGHPVTFARAQCLYHNELTEIPASGIALYLLTGREELTARELFASRTYSGVRVRYPLKDNAYDVRVSAGVDSETEQSSDLWIKVSVSADDHPDELGLLNYAHDRLIEQFIAYTPPWLRESWGEDDESAG
jgi:uncharacterized protein (TIGR04255 family)